MRWTAARCVLVAMAVAAAVWAVRAAAAELADVYLRSGLVLRGEVTRSGDEVVVRNAAGELRLAAADVARIVPVGAPETAPATAPAGAEEDAEAEAEEAEEAAGAEGAGLAPAPPLSERDIQRLKLGELTLDGPPEPVRVRFRRRGQQKDVVSEVLAELRQRPDFKTAWAEVLGRGRPEEKLQLILRETGLKHADRLEVLNDPAAFAMFRRRVLPLVTRGCARSGCHAGTAARAFRFPVGSATGETYAYTTFVLLEQMQTRHGPLLDRASPEQSVLLAYMLPREDNPRAHPPTGRGPSFRPVLRGKDDPGYRAVADWINFLLVPRPDYGLEYRNPYPGPFAPEAPGAQAGQPQAGAAPASAPAGPAGPPATQPGPDPAGR